MIRFHEIAPSQIIRGRDGLGVLFDVSTHSFGYVWDDGVWVEVSGSKCFVPLVEQPLDAQISSTPVGRDVAVCLAGISNGRYILGFCTTNMILSKLESKEGVD